MRRFESSTFFILTCITVCLVFGLVGGTVINVCELIENVRKHKNKTTKEKQNIKSLATWSGIGLFGTCACLGIMKNIARHHYYNK